MQAQADFAELTSYLVRSIVSHPDDVQVNVVDGASSVLLELRVNPEDVDQLQGNDGKNFQAIQQVLSAAGGRRKPVLDLIQGAHGSEAEE